MLDFMIIIIRVLFSNNFGLTFIEKYVKVDLDKAAVYKL